MRLSQAANSVLVQEMKSHEQEAKKNDRLAQKSKSENEQKKYRMRASSSWAEAHKIVRQLRSDPNVCMGVVRRVRYR